MSDQVESEELEVFAEFKKFMSYFNYKHLPMQLQGVSKPFHDLAWELVDLVPDGEEARVALRKLLEAKDAAVRAAL